MPYDDYVKDLRSALRILETYLESPIVSGESANWIRYVKQACGEVWRLLSHDVRTRHDERFREITALDADLLPRIQRLREEDAQILDDCKAFMRSISTLEPALTAGVPITNEPGASDAISPLVKSGITLVIRVRTQEAALSTWQAEALQRDRGIVD